MGTNVYLPNSISWPTSTEVEHKNCSKLEESMKLGTKMRLGVKKSN